MQKIKKILVFVLILTLLDLTRLPVEVNALGRLGVNLFSNPGFEQGGKFDFAPFIVKYNSDSLANVFAKGEIVDGVGVGGSRALEAELMPTCSGKIYGTFTVNPRSTYRLSAAGRRTEDDDNPMHIGVRNYDEDITNSEAISGKFDTLEYQTKYVDFVVGKETTDVEIFIYYPKPKAFYQTGGYIDNLVIEEITYPPIINPIYDPTIAKSITGTAEPGMTVKITLPDGILPDGTEETLEVDENGTFSLPIELGSLNDGDIITAVQYGLYGVESAPQKSTVAEKRLGKNLFKNPGFELPDDFNFYPFTVDLSAEGGGSASGVFSTAKIKDGYGYKSSRALNLVIDKGAFRAGEAVGIFPVIPRSNYRVSAYGYIGDRDNDKNRYSKEVQLRVEGNNIKAYNGSTLGPVIFKNFLNYEYRNIDFLAQNGATEITTYINITRPMFSKFEYSYFYMDDFVIEETAFPPEINEVIDASATTTITGESDPGTVVEATILSGDNLSYTGVTGYDGIYSITIPSGSVNHGTTVEVRQHGLYDTISEPNSIITKDTVPPPAPSINVVRNNDKVLTGKSEPLSKVTIEFEDGFKQEVDADSIGNYSMDLKDRDLIAGQLIKATAKDASGNISDTTTTRIMDEANTIVNTDEGIAIYAKNFILNVGETPDLTQEKVLKESNASAFRLDNVDSLLDINVNSSVFRDEVGVYRVFLNVEDVTRMIYVSVIDEENSIVREDKDLVIYAKDFSIKHTNVNSNLDIAEYSGLKAWKLSNGDDLIKSVAIDASALVAEEGIYEVKFKLKDETHTIEVTVLEEDVTSPEIYDYEIISPSRYDGCNWVNEDIVIKLYAKDDVAIDYNTYEVSTDLGDNWTKAGLSEQTVNSVKLTISSEGEHENVLVRVNDTGGNPSNNYNLIKYININIDRTLPTSNYTNKVYTLEELPIITFDDALSGISSARLDGKEILSDFVVPEGRGEHILVIIDKAGNMLKINFIIGSINTEVKIDGIMFENGVRVPTIKREEELIPETTVILRNSENEYIGFLKYGETLVFKELPYGKYQVLCINPADIEINSISIADGIFIISQQTPSNRFTIKSNFVKLKGFGNIHETNNVNKQ